MTSKTKNTKTISKKVEQTSSDVAAVVTIDQTDQDFKNALLIVSLAVNSIVLIAWVALKVTSQFDYQVASLLFYR